MPWKAGTMTERPGVVVSIFSKVDQTVMRNRLAESPLEDAEVGFLTDRDASGQREVCDSLLAGIRIFAGVDERADTEQPAPEPSTVDAEAPFARVSPENSRESFILFGPGGKTAGSA